MTVKLHAVVQVKTIFYWWSENTEREREEVELVDAKNTVDVNTGVKPEKTCLKILCDLIVCTK